jgi:hypothetical protein
VGDDAVSTPQGVPPEPTPMEAFEAVKSEIATAAAADRATEQRVDKAIAQAATDCLARSGVAHDLTTPTSAVPAYDYPNGTELWTWDQSDFGLATSLENPAVRQSFLDRGARGSNRNAVPPEGFQQAYFGPPSEVVTIEAPSGDVVDVLTGGCAAKAVEEVYGATIEDVERTRISLLPVLNIHETAIAEAPVAQASKAWQACMSDVGFDDLLGPDDVTAPLGEALTPVLMENESTAGLAETESELAQAHVNCLNESFATAEYLAAYTETANRLLEKHDAALSHWQQLRAQAMKSTDEGITE